MRPPPARPRNVTVLAVLQIESIASVPHCSVAPGMRMNGCCPEAPPAYGLQNSIELLPNRSSSPHASNTATSASATASAVAKSSAPQLSATLTPDQRKRPPADGSTATKREATHVTLCEPNGKPLAAVRRPPVIAPIGSTATCAASTPETASAP